MPDIIIPDEIELDENKGLCICPRCGKMYFGNPDTDQLCFEHWLEDHWDELPDEEEISEAGAAGWSYYQIPNTIRPMSHEDWIDYMANCPHNAFASSIYRTVLHNSATPALNGIQVVIGFQRYHVEHNGWADIGYHGVWTPDGQGYIGRNWTYQGAHAHASGNRGSLGWCMVGNFSTGFPTNAQIEEYGWVANEAEKYFRITTHTGHRWVDTHPTTCPGLNISLDMIKDWTEQEQPQPPIPEEGDEDDMVVDFEYMGTDSNGLHKFVAAEGFKEVGGYKYGSCWLLIKNASENKIAKVEIHTTPFTDVALKDRTFDIPPDNDEKSRFGIDMATLMPKDGFATTVKSTVKQIVPQLSMIDLEKK